MAIDRTTYIGGSDAATLVGKNEYNAAKVVWEIKTGKVEPPEFSSNDIDRGVAIEPIVEDYIRETHSPDINSKRWFDEYNSGDGHDGQIFVRHPKYDWIGGHVDGIGTYMGDVVVWEIKAPRSRTVDTLQKYGLNSRYYYQAQHYMLATGIQKAVFAIWSYDRWEPIIIEVPASPLIQENLLKMYFKLHAHIEAGVEPVFKVDLPETVDSYDEDELDQLLGDYDTATTLYYVNRDVRKDLKGQILTLIGESNKVVTKNHVATIKRNVGKYGSTYLTVSQR